MRTSAAATANAPCSAPITDADSPRSCPSSGSTNMCTSQAIDCSQLTSSRRRMAAWPSKSHTEARSSPAAAGTTGARGVPRNSAQHSSGSAAISPKAQR